MISKSNYISLMLGIILISSFISGCTEDASRIQGTKINVSNEGKPVEEVINIVSEEISNSTETVDIVSLNETSNDVETESNSFDELQKEQGSCITRYPMFYTDEKGDYRSTQVKLENYSLSFSAGQDYLSIRFDARINTINPDEERYSFVGGYDKRLPNDESSCINPEWIFNSYSLALCNITEVESEMINSQKYQGEVLIFNHSIAGCFANHSSERRVWFGGCNEGSTSRTCNLQAFSGEDFFVIAQQKSEDEIKSINLRINDGDVLPTWNMFQTKYVSMATFAVATDSLTERLYKLDIDLTLKSGKKENYKRQIKITSPPPLSDYEFDPDCFSDVTLKMDIPVNIQYMGEVTLENIFRMPQMVYITTRNIHTPWALGYGTERSFLPDYKVIAVDFDRREITLQTYDPFCKGVPN